MFVEGSRSITLGPRLSLSPLRSHNQISSEQHSYAQVRSGGTCSLLEDFHFLIALMFSRTPVCVFLCL